MIDLSPKDISLIILFDELSFNPYIEDRKATEILY